MAVSAGRVPAGGTRGTDKEAVLGALADPGCRCILRAIGPSALTASECSAACDLPLSTTYRKLERLAEAGLLEEQLRLRRDGKHASQYRRRFDGVQVALDEDGTFDVAIDPRAEAGAALAPADD